MPVEVLVKVITLFDVCVHVKLACSEQEVIVTVQQAVQLCASVTHTVYEPGKSPVAEEVV